MKPFTLLPLAFLGGALLLSACDSKPETTNPEEPVVLDTLPADFKYVPTTEDLSALPLEERFHSFIDSTNPSGTWYFHKAFAMRPSEFYQTGLAVMLWGDGYYNLESFTLRRDDKQHCQVVVFTDGKEISSEPNMDDTRYEVSQKLAPDSSEWTYTVVHHINYEEPKLLHDNGLVKLIAENADKPVRVAMMDRYGQIIDEVELSGPIKQAFVDTWALYVKLTGGPKS